MAESIVKFVLGKLADATVQELLHLCGVDKQVKLVSDELGWIQAFLKDADRKNNSGDERQRHWVKEMREVAYDIEDAIDKACVLGIKVRESQSMTGVLKKMFKSPKKLPALHELGVEINEILERIKKISESREKYGINNLGESSRGQMKLPVRQLLIPDFDDPDVVGFERDTDNIVKELLDGSTKRRYVISIIGPGGLGKTTLARKVYNSPGVKTDTETKFDIRIWITISQRFKLIDILRELLEQIRGKPVDLNEQGQHEKYFYKELHDSLYKKKYLVVLDDVWTNKLWDQIKEAFPDIKNGSRVLITTRSMDVAKSFDSPFEPYKLSNLTKESSLDLLLKKAFPYQDSSKDYPDNLVDLAKEFAIQCGGLPLALVILGALLSRQPSDGHSWRKVTRNMQWRADVNDILATSYDDLPLALKSCFMYFAIFPEDYVIDAKALIRMWIAEGFIPHFDKRGTLEDTAENFLEDLVQRSLVQVSQRALNGSIEHCCMHDLLHDMAMRKAEEDNFLLVMSPNQDGQIKSGRGTRRVAIHDQNHELMKDTSPNLRSVFCFERMPNLSGHRQGQLKVLMEANYDFSLNITDKHSLLAAFKFMQAGGGNIWNSTEVDERNGPLTSLRYLELSSLSSLGMLRGINILTFLQTLDFRCMEFFQDLPDWVWHIKTLRHVLLPILRYSRGPPPLVEMRNLQTLGGVKPRLSWKEQGLPYLPCLRELHMKVDNGFPWEVLVTFIGTLKHLESLTIVGLQPEQENEIRNNWKHVFFNHQGYCNYRLLWKFATQNGNLSKN